MAVMADAVLGRADLRNEASPWRIGIPDFGGWMESEQKRIFLLCFRMLGSQDEADTATQDAFFKAYRALERDGSRTPDEPARWLTRIAVNTCLDRLRSRRWRFWKQRPSQEDEEAILALARASGPSPETALFSKEIMDRLGKALMKLSFRQRAVFVLRHYEDRTLEEIGAILKLEVGTVKAHMARAVARLRVDLKDLYERRTLER